jgi:Ca2+-binding EF-hand superfamily protein
MIQTLASDEISLENFRIVLVENIDFEPFSCFQELDKQQLNLIHYKDIQQYFERNQIDCSDAEAAQIVAQFGMHSKEVLDFNDFCKIVLPATLSSMHSIAAKRRSPIKIPFNVEFQLSRLLEKELLLQRNLARNRQLLSALDDFNVRSSFKSIDYKETGYFNKDLLTEFMRKNGIYFSNVEINAVMKRWDRDNDERISYAEYTEGIIPPALLLNIANEDSMSVSSNSTPNKMRKKQKVTPDIGSYSTQIPSSDVCAAVSGSFEKYYSGEQQTSLSDYDTANFNSFGTSFREFKEYTFSDNQTLNSNSFDRSSPINKIGTSSDNNIESASSSSESHILIRNSTFSEDHSITSKSSDKIPMTSTFSDKIHINSTFSDKIPMTSTFSDKILMTSTFSDKIPLTSTFSDKQSTINYVTFSPDPELIINTKPTRSSSPTSSPKKLSYIKQDLHYNKDPMPAILYSQEMDLFTWLKSQIELFRHLENARILLANMQDFNLVDGFRQFDTKGKAVITYKEMEEGLLRLGIKIIGDEVELLVKCFSSFKDNKLRFNDWVSMICSRDKHFAKILMNRNTFSSNPKKPPVKFIRETKRGFVEVLKRLLEMEIECEKLRRNLERRPLFNINEAFGILDSDKDGFIGPDELDKLLSLHGRAPLNKDLNWLIDRLDKNKDGKISYTEFSEELLPHSPFNY